MMKFFLISALAIGWMAPFLDCNIETGWKGIVVFQTTRAEVEKVLNAAVDDDGTVNYKTEDALVHVIYSVDPCSSDQRDRGKFNVPKDTVLWYWVVLKKEIDLQEFNYKPELYERIADPHMKGSIQYFNQRDGISFKTEIRNGKEMAWGITFERTVNLTEKFRCKSENK